MQEKICLSCEYKYELSAFIPTKSIFHRNGCSNICTNCLEQRLNMEDLNDVDKYLRWLDIEFHPDEWIKTYKKTRGKNTLRVYCAQHTGEGYETIDWGFANKKWKELDELNQIKQELSIVRESTEQVLKHKWGEQYDFEDLIYMDELYESFKKSSPSFDKVTADGARQAAYLNYIIHKKIHRGEDCGSDQKNYFTLLKQYGFGLKEGKDRGELETFGETINYLVRTGFTPIFYDEKDRDVIDEMMKGMQSFTKRLVANDPNIQELLDATLQRIEREGIAEEIEDEDYTLSSTGEALQVDYEDVADWELE